MNREHERRNNERLSVKIVAHCTRQQHGLSPAEHFLSFTKDLTVGGARLIVAEDVGSGDPLSMSLEIPTAFIPALVYGKVIWAQGMVIWGERFHSFTEAGVQFLDMNAQDTEKLGQFIESRLQKQILQRSEK